jgi:predicted acetyltransferase
VLEVSDEFIPELGGRWRLVVTDGQASVEATDAPAEIELEINDLASAYLGAFSFADLGRAGRTRELADGARQRGDRLFRTDLAPWCPEVF